MPNDLPRDTKSLFFSAFIDGLIFNNLTLVDFVGLTPIIAGGDTVESGLILSAATLIVLVLVTLFAAFAGKKLTEKFLPVACTLLSAVLLLPLALLFYRLMPNAMIKIGYIFFLVAVNGITLNRVRNFRDRGIAATVGDAVGKGLGFAIVMFAVSALREILGYGTFFNLPVPFFAHHASRLFAGVPGGFFFLAVLAQTIKFISLKRQKNKEAANDDLPA